MYSETQSRKISKLHVKKGALPCYILLYVLLIVHGAVIWTVTLKDLPNKPLIVLLIIGAISIIKKVRINKVIIIYAAILILCYGISAHINDGGFLSGTAVRSASTTAVFAILGNFVYEYDKKNALARYVKFVVLIAMISLFFFMLQIVLGTGLFQPPVFPEVGIRSEYGIFFYTVSKTDIFRNYGIFYEPGVYEILLNMCLFLIAFYKEKLGIAPQKLSKYLVVIIFTILTTRSTTGLISLLIILSTVILQGDKKIRRKVIYIFSALMAFALIDVLVNGSDSFISRNVLQKIMEIGFSNGTYNRETAGGARFFVIDKAIQAMKVNPFWGIGDTGYGKLIAGTRWARDGAGNILFTIIATRGLISVCISIALIVYMAYRSKKNIWLFGAFILIYLNTVLGQSHIIDPVFIMVASIDNDIGRERVSNSNKLHGAF